MHPPIPRRLFLRRAAASTFATSLGFQFVTSRVLAAHQRLRLAVMGVNDRGRHLAGAFAARPDVEIAYACDVDERALDKAFAAVAPHQPSAPRGVKDFRHCLDDPEVDALVIAAPDHWHAPATILACAAGKHVYVEKPASHNPREGELLIAAAQRHRRVVQVGTQRRSLPQLQEAMAKIRDGVLGRVRFVRGWYSNRRGGIGRGQPVPVPAWLDWSLWQGPAPDRPYRDNIVHYNWHWFWHWGTGELGNNGIHALDLCQWGLDAGFPRRVSAGGGRYHFEDDQETPDTHVVTFDFGDYALSWEGRSCLRRGVEGSGFGAAFYGEQGSLVTDGSGYALFDPNDKEISRVSGSGSDTLHLQDFLDGIREGKTPRADVATAHRGTLLCHLGNIAWRVGRTLDCDPRTGRILRDPDAMQLWGREYRPGWEPEDYSTSTR